MIDSFIDLATRIKILRQGDPCPVHIRKRSITSPSPASSQGEQTTELWAEHHSWGPLWQAWSRRRSSKGGNCNRKRVLRQKKARLYRSVDGSILHTCWSLEWLNYLKELRINNPDPSLISFLTSPPYHFWWVDLICDELDMSCQSQNHTRNEAFLFAWPLVKGKVVKMERARLNTKYTSMLWSGLSGLFNFAII